MMYVRHMSTNPSPKSLLHVTKGTGGPLRLGASSTDTVLVVSQERHQLTSTHRYCCMCPSCPSSKALNGTGLNTFQGAQIQPYARLGWAQATR